MHFHIPSEVYCSDTEEQPSRDFCAFDIFFQRGVFLAWSHKGQDLANKEGAEARKPFPVSDIPAEWPLCVTKHCCATT